MKSKMNRIGKRWTAFLLCWVFLLQGTYLLAQPVLHDVKVKEEPGGEPAGPSGPTDELDWDFKCYYLYDNAGDGSNAVFLNPSITEFAAAPGERVLYKVALLDVDARIKICDNEPNGDVTPIKGLGPYLFKFSSASVYASFSNGMQEIELTYPGSDLNELNQLVTETIEMQFSPDWPSSEGVIVWFFDFKDDAPDSTPPDQGHTRDGSVSVIGVIDRTEIACPQTLDLVNGTMGIWHDAKGDGYTITLKLAPDIGNDGVADYEERIINETFDPIIPAFTWNDLSPAWLAAHPDLNDLSSVVNYLFDANNFSGNFVADNNDQIMDTYKGAEGLVDLYVQAFDFPSPEAYFGYQKTQYYKCGDNVLRQQTLFYRFNEAGDYEVRIEP